MVGVFFGPGVFNLLHLSCFADGHATATLLLLAQLGGYVLMFIAGIETDIDRMREASATAFVVALSGVIWPFLLGAGRWTSLRVFLDNCLLPGRSLDGHQRLDLRPHFDGRGPNVLPRSNRDFGRGGDR